MLVISRKAGESFYIGKDVCISVSEISGDKVKIAISAPKDVRILRGELKEAVDYNLEAASEASKASVSALSAAVKKNKGNL